MKINDCLFIYMKFKAMATSFNMSNISFGAIKKYGPFVPVAYCITDHFRLLP